MNLKGLLIIGAIVAALIGGTVFVGPKLLVRVPKQVFAVGRMAPDFTLRDFEGRQVALSDFYGKKAVVLDFFAAWCPFCIKEMPELEKAHKAYGDRLIMVGIHRTDSGESIETGKKFADEQGVTYLLLQGTPEIYEASTKGLKAMPVAIFIDSDGVVQDVKAGPKTEEEIKERVLRLIQ